MDLKYRLMIARIKPLHRLCRAAMYESGIFYYKKLYREKGYEQIFRELKGSKAGKRCFIIGNGPSLTPQDLDKLAGEDCFGTNAIYKVFPHTVWRPKYYVLIDRYLDIDQEQLRDMDCERAFISDYYCRFNKVLREDIVCLHQHYILKEENYHVTKDLSRYFVLASTVSFTAMQIAAYMGYSQVYLLGFDNNYTYQVDDAGRVQDTGTGRSHFYEDKDPKAIIADVKGNTLAYETFKKYAERNGITVANATRGGHLEVFPRVDLDRVLSQGAPAEQ